MQDLQLVSIWDASRKQNTSVNHHTHNYHELVYYSSGSGETEIGGKTFSYVPRCFAVVPAQTPHNEIRHYDTDVICLGLLSEFPLPRGFYSDSSSAIYKVLKELLKETKEQHYGYEKMVVIKLRELLLLIARTEKNTGATKNFTYIINYLKENSHDHINLSHCAKQLNISYDYFQHKFKVITGLSPQQFLIEQRLIAAKSLLSEGSVNCTEIAYRCGFCTSAQFSALFKKKYGITPTQYKRSIHKKA